jgi:hypothetical protein
MKRFALVLAILTLVAIPALAGEWHTGQSNLCADCHTMHNSMSHAWDGVSAVTVGTPSADGNWVAAAGPAGDFLLKAADPNALCLACHDNQTFAPDVVGAAKTANDATNRAAGYLNETTDAVTHTGHTLGALVDAPGDAVANLYTPDATHGLQCINCHTQHGRAGIYRNLGPRTNNNMPLYALNGQQPRDMVGQPTDLAGATGSATIDVFINLPGAYTPNVSNFAALYETANIQYLKRAVLTDGVENRTGTQCASCHGDFHGAVDGADIGGEATTPAAGYTSAYEQFNRHPVGNVLMGSVGGGHSDPVATRYANAASVSRVKVYADDQTDFTDATPGCVSCHKAHGNGQPFGLIFANRTVAGMTEEGTMAANPTPTGADTAIAQRALCGQCHRQGS